MEWTLPVLFSGGAGLIVLGLALVVFAVAPHRSSNRALAVFLALFAVIRMLEALEMAAGDGAGRGAALGGSFWLGLGGYFWLVDDLALLYFVTIVAVAPTPRARGWLLAAVLTLSALLWVWYALDHGALFRGPGAPLLIVDYVLTGTAYGVVPAGLVWWSRRLAPRRAVPIVLVASGLAAWFVAYVAGATVLLFLFGRFSWVPAVQDSLTPGLSVFFTTSILCLWGALMVLFGVLTERFVRGDPRAAWSYRLGVVLLTAAGISGVGWAFWFVLRPESALVAALIVGWFLAGSLLVAYAVLRHQLFDIDLKLKWTLKRSTLVAIFLGAFFVAAQVAQEFLVTEWGWAVGGIAAGLLLLAINPLQRFSGHVADAAMPNVEDTAEYRSARKRELYRAALEEMLSDGTVSLKERRVLLRLQEQLGLDAAQANRLELDVIQALGGSE